MQNYPTSKEGVHQQREVPDFGLVKSAELSQWAMRECTDKERGQTLVGSECIAESTGKLGLKVRECIIRLKGPQHN